MDFVGRSQGTARAAPRRLHEDQGRSKTRSGEKLPSIAFEVALMAYLVFKKGKRISSGVSGRAAPYVWTKREVDRLRRGSGCFKIAYTKTQRVFHVGGACKRRRRRKR